MSDNMKSYVMGLVLGWLICVCFILIGLGIRAISPAGQCDGAYGTKTREYAICVYELEQHIIDKP